MNHDHLSPRRQLYELLEVLRPDFDEHGGDERVGIALEDRRVDSDASLNAEQARRLKEEDGLSEARKKIAKLLQEHPDLIDAKLIDTWHDIAWTDEYLGEAIQDIAVPEHIKQEMLTMVENHKSSAQTQAASYKRLASKLSIFALGLSFVTSLAVFLIKLIIYRIAAN